MDEIADFGGHIDEMTVFADEHPFRFGAGWHFLDNDVLVDVDHREGRALLVGHVDAAAGLVDGEGLRARAGRELAYHLELGNVDDIDHVVATAGDIKLSVIRIAMPLAP